MLDLALNASTRRPHVRGQCSLPPLLASFALSSCFFLFVARPVFAAEDDDLDLGGLPNCTFDGCTQCLEDGLTEFTNLSIVASDRNTYSSAFRIGRALAWYDSQSVTATIAGILISEVLGVAVEYVPLEDEAQGAYGVNNCLGWLDYECGQAFSVEDAELAYEVGMKVYPDLLADAMYYSEAYPSVTGREHFEGTDLIYDLRPSEVVGPAGYNSVDSLFIWPDIVETAWNNFSVDLNSIMGYQTAAAKSLLTKPQVLIDDGVIDKLWSCEPDDEATKLSMDLHWDAGWNCTNETFWLNPACAEFGEDWREECIVVIEDAWEYAKPWLYSYLGTSDVPVAKVTVGYNPWWDILYYREYDVLFTWWTPDSTLGLHFPKRVYFPFPNPLGGEIAVQYAWQPATNADNRIGELLRQMLLDDSQISNLMAVIAASWEEGYEPDPKDDNGFWQKISCDWIRNNSDVWEEWLPSERSCSIGQEFIASSRRCIACPIGTAGKIWANGSFYCELCEAGSYTNLPGTTECLRCSSGSYQPDTGSSLCERCPVGQSQHQQGSSECELCAAGTAASQPGSDSCAECSIGTSSIVGSTTCAVCSKGRYANETAVSECYICAPGLVTTGKGSTSIIDCVCRADSYDVTPTAQLESGASRNCQDCPDYMDCQVASSYDDFANSVDGSAMVLQAGYMTLTGEPGSVYRCLTKSACPGGLPGMCGTNRDPSRIGCSTCLENFYKRNGACEPCGEHEYWMIVLAIAVALCGIAAASVAASREAHMVSNSRLMVAILIGLTFSSLQVLGIFRDMEINWFSPVSEIMASVSVLAFDLEILKTDCLMDTSPSSVYGFRQVLPLLCIPWIVTILSLKRLASPHFDLWTGFLNAVGTVFNVFFISIAMQCILPFACYPHPNGSSSVVAYPSILCFETPDHVTMVIVGVAAFILVPLAFFSTACVATYLYPSWAASPTYRSTYRMRQTRFLFFRYRPDCYFYCIIFLMRNLTISLIPAIFDAVPIQVSFLVIAFLFFAFIQQQLKPWRSLTTNILDGFLNGGLVVTLVCGAMTTELALDDRAVQTMASVCLIGMFIVCAFGVSIAGVNAMRVRPFYRYFICHHKADAQAQARLLKIRLAIATGRKIFIDSDDLSDLDGLFDIVKSRMHTLIVYLTRDTLTRPWCAGEIVTAHKCKKNITRVVCTSFVFPSEEIFEDLESYIDSSGCSLSQYAINFEDIANAFRHLGSTELVKMHSDRFGSERFEAMFEELQEVLQSSGGVVRSLFATAARSCEEIAPASPSPAPPRLAREGGGQAAPRHSIGGEGNPIDKPNLVLISVRPGDDEAAAAGTILVGKLNKELLTDNSISIRMLEGATDVETEANMVLQARAVIVLLSRDSLMSESQVLMIVKGQAYGKYPLPVVLPYFQFPGEDYYQMQLRKLDMESPDVMAAMIRGFFKQIAVSFATNASDTVLNVQAIQIAQRVKLAEQMQRRRPPSLPGTATNSEPPTAINDNDNNNNDNNNNNNSNSNTSDNHNHNNHSAAHETPGLVSLGEANTSPSSGNMITNLESVDPDSWAYLSTQGAVRHI